MLKMKNIARDTRSAIKRVMSSRDRAITYKTLVVLINWKWEEVQAYLEDDEPGCTFYPGNMEVISIGGVDLDNIPPSTLNEWVERCVNRFTRLMKKSKSDEENERKKIAREKRKKAGSQKAGSQAKPQAKPIEMDGDFIPIG